MKTNAMEMERHWRDTEETSERGTKLLLLTTEQIRVFVICLQNQFKNLEIHMVQSQGNV